MKRMILVLILLGASLLMAKEWIPFNSEIEELPQIDVLNSDNSALILNVKIPGMYVENLEFEGETYQKLEIIERRNTHEVGKPQLPMITRIIGIPDNQQVSVRILETQTQQLSGYNVFPLQTPTKDGENGKFQFVKDEAYYKSGKSFPADNAFVDNVGIWRDVKIGGFHFIPFNYNSLTGDLEVITSAKIEIDFFGYDTEHVLNRDKFITPDFYQMYDSALINFSSMGYQVDNTDDVSIKYLIVTNTSVTANIQPFVDLKNQQGLPVEVRTLETGFQTAQEIKNYINQLYTSDDLEYVLMVGDAYPNGSGGPDNVPMYLWSGGGESSWSDSWYSCLDGNTDYYADIAIGRITYDNTTELDHQIQKLMDYYQTPDQTTNWGENSILVAHSEQYPQKYTQCKQEIHDFPYSIQTPIFTQCYGGAGAGNNDIINWVNTTSGGIFNYRGHGSETELWQWGSTGSFTATHVNQLTNDNRNFVMFDVCCSNMDIVGHNGNCLAESFMKADEAAIAINGAINPSYTIPNHDYDKESYKAIFDQGINNIGYITNYANIFVVNLHGSIGIANVLTYLWLGDSSISPWTKQIDDLIVTHDPQLFLGLDTFDVNVLGNNGPVENARVCISHNDGTILGIGFTDAAGYVQVQFDGPVVTPGTAYVNVSAHNYLDYNQDIPIIAMSSPYPIYNSHIINDSAGNGNGLVDYNESILLTIAMENVGVQPVDNITVEISTDDTNITITDNTEFYGSFAVGGIVSVTDGFAFDVNAVIPDGHYVFFDVMSTDGTSFWYSTFALELHAPVLEYDDYVVDDSISGNGNGKLDPGETVDFIITINNTGSSNSLGVEAELTSVDPFITINSNGYQSFGDINAAGSADQSFSVTASDTTPAGHMAEFDLDIQDAAGYNQFVQFTNVVGQIPVLILDLDPNHSSGPEMQTALTNIGISCEYLSSFPADLNLYTSIFTCLGIYSTNHELTNAEGQNLADFLNLGGYLYMEGGDTWYYDDQTPVHSMFNINATSDGSSDMGTIVGQSGTFAEGWTFSYTGENSWMDHIEPVTPAEDVFRNQSPDYGCTIIYDEGSYRTIGASYEFGGLSDGTYTKEQLMTEYATFFGLIQTVTGTVAGTVIDSDTGNPIEGVVVNGVTTGIDGTYTFNIAPGTYDFTFTHADYYDYLAEDVVVAEDQTTNLNVSMTPLPVLDPPNNFAGVVEDVNSVLLTWDPPGGPTEEILHHSGYDNNGIGTGTAVDFICAARFDAVELASYYGGWSITGVNVFLHSADFSYVGIQVYEGGSYGNPGTLVYEQDVTASAQVGAFTNHLLTTPVPLVAGNEYWLAYDISATGDHPAAVDMGPMVTDKGAWMYYSGAWSTLVQLGATLDYNWVITGVVSQSDVAVGKAQTAVIGKAQTEQIQSRGMTFSSASFSAARTTSLRNNVRRIENSDNSRALLGYTIYRDGTSIGTVAPAILEYTDECLDAGDYVYTIVANYDEGDSDPAGPIDVTIVFSAPNGCSVVSSWPNIIISCNGVPGAISYNIYMDGTLIANTNSLFYIYFNVPEGTYVFNIAAVFPGDYEGPWSDDIIVEHYPIGSNPELIPLVTSLDGNYPNPFNPTTTIKFGLSNESHVTLEVYNIKGEKVTTLIDGELEAKFHNVVWNGKDDNNKSVSSGVYFYKMKADKFVQTKKMILMK